ncbi:sodium:proline symporter [Nitrincola nitratireducens]|uniref:Na+/panthothenate symporter n=1 Tax=Nitrincola nitratireducens TaxID=1229521 RepID=W9VMV9_9GAMM|nr:sodium:proline symporter [Nitrincola nitratireducens]EXJ11830.1 Na+/panthothenate symporter [Nitrincola nitratireducens]
MLVSSMQIYVMVAALLVVTAFTLMTAPAVKTAEGFFSGKEQGSVPSLWTLTLSQVTTWIFARSLLNAAILGYLFGIAGTLAYGVYYGSFLTGWLIIDRLRFHHGETSIQDFFARQFGRLGSYCYNLLVSLRLLSEVFANLLVVGIVFGAVGSGAWQVSILLVAGLTLVYSMRGGLSASLKTDVQQMLILLVILAGLMVLLLTHQAFEWPAILNSSPELTNPGWILLIVALLQVISYPLHDPVMMDRGLLADRQTTRKSFIHAFWISILFILLFGLLGVFAGLHRMGEEELMSTLQRLFGTPVMLLVGMALIISAASTMDSTLSSASRLAVVEMKIGQATPATGRWAMLLFMLGGLFLVYVGTNDLFAAVAVSGTASLFLTPVIIFNIWLKRDVARWSFAVNFIFAVLGSVLYFLETSGHTNLLGDITGLSHSYSKLLVITFFILIVGLFSFALGLEPKRKGSVNERRA